MKGRKPHSQAELLLMAEISMKFTEVLQQRRWKAEEAAKELGVSRASFYNYLAKKDLPRFEVLRRAGQMWNVRFENLDALIVRRRGKRRAIPEGQLSLPFIEALREEDVEVVQVTPKKPNAVELKVRIKFAG